MTGPSENCFLSATRPLAAPSTTSSLTQPPSNITLLSLVRVGTVLTLICPAQSSIVILILNLVYSGNLTAYGLFDRAAVLTISRMGPAAQVSGACIGLLYVCGNVGVLTYARIKT